MSTTTPTIGAHRLGLALTSLAAGHLTERISIGRALRACLAPTLLAPSLPLEQQLDRARG